MALHQQYLSIIHCPQVLLEVNGYLFNVSETPNLKSYMRELVSMLAIISPYKFTAYQSTVVPAGNASPVNEHSLYSEHFVKSMSVQSCSDFQYFSYAFEYQSNKPAASAHSTSRGCFEKRWSHNLSHRYSLWTWLQYLQ